MSVLPTPEATAPAGLLIVGGPFGSGKTEVAIALAEQWGQTTPVTLVDLDLVTPYFRSRDVRPAELGGAVDVLAPEGEAGASDVPVIAARLSSVLRDRERLLIVDCGGDPVGATVLAQFRSVLLTRGARVAVVLNPRRPATQSAAATAAAVSRLLDAARVPLGGLVANGNMGVLTTPADFRAGVELATEVAASLGTEVLFAAAPEGLLPACAPLAPHLPLLPIRRRMTSPWEGPVVARSEPRTE